MEADTKEAFVVSFCFRGKCSCCMMSWQRGSMQSNRDWNRGYKETSTIKVQITTISMCQTGLCISALVGHSAVGSMTGLALYVHILQWHLFSWPIVPDAIQRNAESQPLL